jgi:hypothetical protein
MVETRVVDEELGDSRGLRNIASLSTVILFAYELPATSGYGGYPGRRTRNTRHHPFRVEQPLATFPSEHTTCYDTKRVVVAAQELS